MNDNKISALQATVMVAFALFMVGKALVEIYVMIGKLAYRFGKYVGGLYYSSKYYNPVVSEITEAVSTEASEVKQCIGKYLCGWLLFISTLHASWVYLRRFDYVQSVILEQKIKNKALELWNNYEKLVMNVV